MNKRLICPNCGLKNLIWRTDCKYCRIDMLDYLFRHPFVEAKLIDVGASSRMGKRLVFGLPILFFILITTFVPESGFFAGLMTWIVLFTMAYNQVEKKFLEDIEAVSAKLSIEQARQIYYRYLELGPENGMAVCVEEGCRHNTLVYSSYCKRHWFCQLEGEQGLVLLDAYVRHLTTHRQS
ncbi:MAG: hypothetical protein AAF490_04080 [Chloroflexota bacterium]